MARKDKKEGSARLAVLDHFKGNQWAELVSFRLLGAGQLEAGE